MELVICALSEFGLEANEWCPCCPMLFMLLSYALLLQLFFFLILMNFMLLVLFQIPSF